MSYKFVSFYFIIFFDIITFTQYKLTLLMLGFYIKEDIS